MMLQIDFVNYLPSLTKFALVLASVLLLPRLVERLCLPGPIGFLLAALLLGPHDLSVFIVLVLVSSAVGLVFVDCYSKT